MPDTVNPANADHAVSAPIDAVSFLGVDMAPLDMAGALAAVRNLAIQNKFSYVVTPNVDHFVNLYPETSGPRDQLFRDAYQNAALTLCDSRVIYGLARLRGRKLSIVPGSDLTAGLFAHQLDTSDRVAIIGGDNDLLATLTTLFPNPEYVQHIPPMGILSKPEAMNDIISFVANSQAHYILFAIGAPQSEIIAHQCLKAGNCTGVGLCIGASLEFITSVKKRAPNWMQKSGLEWAFRLLNEPTRLWRRYLVKGPRIFKIFMAHKG